MIIRTDFRTCDTGLTNSSHLEEPKETEFWLGRHGGFVSATTAGNDESSVVSRE